ncbi:uncharacterized protein LOC110242863 [Exaiptasia diaphana]|uniref:Tudor domain-containing protein n=1 Tax=Exaiptasia diaphana TaxID=2652724 RepID=A0A913YPB7_EXADI|nr:uncharacterized protein LOC110242863 [Exaiptasia diaphana]
MFTDEWPKLEALSKDLSIFYNSSEGDKYLMPKWLVSVGQVCCAWCEDFGDWFRAVITGFTSMQNIEVFYVDYGNNSRVSLTELRVLRSSFLKIPGQACQAQLAYIKPVKGAQWSPGCCHRFYHLTKNYKALFGLLCGVKDGKISLCLSDTSSNEDIHINDLLVDEGYAVFCPDSPVSPTAPIRPFFDSDTETEKVDKEKDNKPPGLPPARQGQDMFNQHIATTIASSALPEFPFRLEPVCNGYPLQNSLDEMNDIPPSNQESKDDIAFIEEICSEIEQDMEEEYIFKRINLVDICTIHVINYFKVPYVTSADISVLLWDSDVLRAMLRQKKLVVPKLVLSNEEDGDLIDQLVKHEVRGVMDGDTQRSFVTLYPLSSVPNILRKFNHPLEELVSRVELELQQYEEQGEDYWLVRDSESESTGTDSESRDEDASFQMEQLAIDELKLVIQAMQFRRYLFTHYRLS